MNKPGVAAPIVLRQRRGKGQLEGEVAICLLQGLEVVRVKYLLFGSRTVPKADLASRLLSFEQVRNMSTQWRHARAATDVQHFALGGPDMKIAERPDGRDDVPFFEAKDIAGT